MPNPVMTGNLVHTDDATFERIINEIGDRLNAGEAVDVEEYVQYAPEYAERVRKAIPGLKALVELGYHGELVHHDAAGGVTKIRELGDYRILGEIGRGGMGVVYEAEQLSLGRRVALKVLPFAGALDHRQLQRFKNEAQAAALLHHQNIVPVHGIGSDRGVHFYAMQYIEGQTLAEVISDLRRFEGIPEKKESQKCSERARNLTSGNSSSQGQRPSQDELTTEHRAPTAASRETAETVKTPQAALSTERSTKSSAYFRSVAEMGIQVAEALEHAHQEGIVHRDVKPSNLILDQRGKVWVTDFGLALVQADPGLTMSGDIVGTLRYMSPEQALAKRVIVDQRTDIYSLCATLYELLTLQPVFRGVDRQELMKQIAFEEPRRPRSLNRALPVELETIIVKGLEKHPEHRYDSARDLADDLRRFLQHEPIKARQATLIQTATKWTVRHQALTWAAVLTLLVTAIVSLAAGVMIATANRRLATANQQLAEKTEVAERREADARAAEQTASREKEQSERQSEIATGNLYLAHMRQAQQDWDNGQIKRLHDLLEHYLPEPGQRDLRRWEWYYFLSLCYQDLQTLRGHSQGTYWVSWSPDGTRLASASSDMTIKIWDVARGMAVRTLRGHGNGIESVVWSPDGTQLASGSQDGTVKLWAAETGKEVATLTANGRPVSQVAWSPDGRFVGWSQEGGSFTVWDLRNRRQQIHKTFDPDDDGVDTVAWTPDSRLLATGGGSTLSIWDVQSHELVRSWRAHEHDLWTLAWSPSGDRLASGGYDRTVKLWKKDSWEELLSLSHDSGVETVDWSPDGQRLAVATWGQEVKVWDAMKGLELVTFRGHVGRVYAAAWSPDGQRIASSSEDRTIKIWDAAPTREDGPATSSRDVAAAVSPDHNYSMDWKRDSSGSRVIIRHVSPPQDVVLETGVVKTEQIDWDPSCRRVAIPNRKIVGVWDLSTGQQVLSLEGHTGDLWSVRWSPDGQHLASCAFDGTVRIWDAATGEKLHTLVGHRTGHYVDALAWSPDGSRIASGGWDQTIRIWQISSSRELLRLEGHTGAVSELDWSPDGSRLASRDQNGQTIKLWDTSTGQEVLTLTGDGTGPFRWSADGRQLISGKSTFDASLGFELPASPGYASDTAWRHCSRAKQLAYSQRYDEAFAEYEKALSYDPRLQDGECRLSDFPALARYEAGLVLAGIGELDAAIDAYEQTIKLKPDLAKAYQHLGLALLEKGQFDAAIEAYGTAIKLNPCAIFYNDLGSALGEKGDRNEAMAAFRQAIKLQPDFADAYYNLGTALGKNGELDAAIEALSTAVKLKPHFSAARHNLGIALEFKAAALRKNEDWEAAIETYQKAIEVRPDYPKLHNDLAWLLATCRDSQFRNPPKAVELAKQATRLVPNVGTFWNTLGVSQYRAGDDRAAAASLRKSIKLSDGGTSYDFFFLAMALWRIGEHAHARDWYSKAVTWMHQNKPDDEELRRYDVEAKQLLGTRASADDKRCRSYSPSMGKWRIWPIVTACFVNCLCSTGQFT